MTIDFEAIRRRFSLREQIARYGSKVGRDGRFKCVIPGHRDKNPSASVTKVKGYEHWRCHACDKGGDVCDLVAEVEGCTVAEAARRLTGEEPHQRPPKPRARLRPHRHP
jgi:DNA primase